MFKDLHHLYKKKSRKSKIKIIFFHSFNKNPKNLKIKKVKYKNEGILGFL
jgi:hypothetical protein